MKTYLKYNNITVECFPKNALKLSYKKNTDEVFLRRELVDALIFVDDEANNHFDYSNIMNNVLCTEFIFYIPEKDFSASFFITECEIDEYRKTLTVTPITIDEYTPIDNIIDEKINVSAKDIGEIKIKLGNVTYSVTNWWYTVDEFTFADSWKTLDHGLMNDLYEPPFNREGIFIPPVGTLTRLYRYTVRLKYISVGSNGQKIYHCYLILNYRTETVCTGDVLSSGDGWQIKEDISDEFKIYHRRYAGNGNWDYEELIGTAIINPSVGVGNFGEAHPAPGYNFIEQYTYAISNYFTDPNYYNTTVGSYPLLAFLKSYYLDNVEIESEFFNNEINPIAILLGETFSTKYLHVSIFSNFALEIAGLPVERRATKTEITLKEIFDFLYSLFRVRWDIHNGKLRLEHEYFYENHYSYGSANPLIKTINYNNYIYSFSSTDINKGKKLSYNDSKTEEFTEHTMTFKSGNTLCVHQLKDYDSESIATLCNDINYVLYNWDEIRGAAGLIMLHADSNNEIISNISEYDNSTMIPNGFLSILNSLRYFHSILGYFTSAILESKDVNGTKTFDINIKRLKRVKIQRDIMINSSDFDLNYTYVTPIGQGVVEEAEEDLDNGTVNLTLLYD